MPDGIVDCSRYDRASFVRRMAPLASPSAAALGIIGSRITLVPESPSCQYVALGVAPPEILRLLLRLLRLRQLFDALDYILRQFLGRDLTLGLDPAFAGKSLH